MAYRKITADDLLNKGVVGLPDTPGLPAYEMQKKFEEVARDVIVPAFNNLIDELTIEAEKLMSADVYDEDGNGVVDNAQRLGGQLPSYYATAEKLKKTDWFNEGASIPSGADLDEYKTPGKYYNGQSNLASSIDNCPVENDNFGLFVFRRTVGASVGQMIITLGGQLHIRGCDSGGVWREWKTFTTNTKLAEVENSIKMAQKTADNAIVQAEASLKKADRPQGSYIGNGSSSTRTIDMGFNASVVMIRKSTDVGAGLASNNVASFVIVSKHSCAIFNPQTNNVKVSGECACGSDGLKIYSVDDALNTNGTTYYWYVLA